MSPVLKSWGSSGSPIRLHTRSSDLEKDATSKSCRRAKPCSDHLCVESIPNMGGITCSIEQGIRNTGIYIKGEFDKYSNLSVLIPLGWGINYFMIINI
jgi:hypothetical protein